MTRELLVSLRGTRLAIFFIHHHLNPCIKMGSTMKHETKSRKLHKEELTKFLQQL